MLTTRHSWWWLNATAGFGKGKHWQQLQRTSANIACMQPEYVLILKNMQFGGGSNASNPSMEVKCFRSGMPSIRKNNTILGDMRHMRHMRNQCGLYWSLVDQSWLKNTITDEPGQKSWHSHCFRNSEIYPSGIDLISRRSWNWSKTDPCRNQTQRVKNDISQNRRLGLKSIRG